VNRTHEVRGSNPLGSTTTTSGIHQAPVWGVPSGASFGAACCTVSDVTTDRVTIRIGYCPFLDAMNTAHAAVTWLSTVGIGSIRVRRFGRGWRPCNWGWDEGGRR
jgi:hypothetical protein